MLELYHNDISVCAQKVRIVLAEKRLDCISHHINLVAGEQTAPEYLASPQGCRPGFDRRWAACPRIDPDLRISR